MEAALEWYSRGATESDHRCSDRIYDWKNSGSARTETVERHNPSTRPTRNESNEATEPKSVFMTIIMVLSSIVGIGLMAVIGTALAAGAVYIMSFTVPLLIGGYILYLIVKAVTDRA